MEDHKFNFYLQNGFETILTQYWQKPDPPYPQMLGFWGFTGFFWVIIGFIGL